jgi:twitching motility protein PilT
MHCTPAIQHMIRDRKTHSITSAIQTGSQLGMKTLDTSLFDLYKNQVITKEDMLRLAERPDEILEKLGEHVPDSMRTSADGPQGRPQQGQQQRPGQPQPGYPQPQQGYPQQPGGYGPPPGQQGKR